MRRLTLTIALLLAACTTDPARHALPAKTPARDQTPPRGRTLADFAAEDSAQAWLRYGIEGIKRAPEVALHEGALRLTSDDAAGVFFFEAPVDTAAEPVIGWRWRVSEVFADASPFTLEADNFPARVLVGFDASWDGADAVSLSWKGKVEAAIGRTPPARALCYNFGGKQPANEAVDALIGMGRIVVINLRPPSARAGEWYHELRDVAADYAAVFGQKAPPVTYLAISADTHRNHRRVTADFDDFTAYALGDYGALAGMIGPSISERHPAPLAAWIAVLCALAGVGLAAAGLFLVYRRRTAN